MFTFHPTVQIPPPTSCRRGCGCQSTGVTPGPTWPLLTRGDSVEGDALRRTAAQGHAHALEQLLPGEEVLVSWQHLSEAQRGVCPWRDGDLRNSVGRS